MQQPGGPEAGVEGAAGEAGTLEAGNEGGVSLTKCCASCVRGCSRMCVRACARVCVSLYLIVSLSVSVCLTNALHAVVPDQQVHVCNRGELRRRCMQSPQPQQPGCLSAGKSSATIHP